MDLNDIDYCLRARIGAAGPLRTVGRAGASRVAEPGHSGGPEDQALPRPLEGAVLAGDPFLSPHLTRMDCTCALRAARRRGGGSNGARTSRDRERGPSPGRAAGRTPIRRRSPSRLTPAHRDHRQRRDPVTPCARPPTWHQLHQHWAALERPGSGRGPPHCAWLLSAARRLAATAATGGPEQATQRALIGDLIRAAGGPGRPLRRSGDPD